MPPYPFSRLFSALLVGLMLLAGMPLHAQDSGEFPAEQAAQITDIMNGLVYGKSTPGIIIAVSIPGATFKGAAGLANVEAQTPMQPDDPFRVNDVTQMFTATVILQLIEEGMLSLDDPLSKWLPDVATQLPYSDQITLRHLLNHTSGIRDYWENIRPGMRDRLGRQWTADELLAFALEDEPFFAPGEDWSYSYTNYYLLGMVIEAATGNSAATEFRARIFEPLGMSSTYLADAEPPIGTLVHGYRLASGRGDLEGYNASELWTAGAIVSTADDLITFTRALFNGELFQDAATLEMMTDIHDDMGFGLGLFEYTPQRWGYFTFGLTNGFSVFLAYNAAQDSVEIVVFNTNNTINGGTLGIGNNVIAEVTTAAVRAGTP